MAWRGLVAVAVGSNIVGAAALLLAMILGSVLLRDPGDLGLGYIIPTVYVPLLLAAHFYALKYAASVRAGEALLSTRRQRPTRGGGDDGNRPGQPGAGDPFQPGEIHRFAYSVVDFGGFGGECPS